MHASNPDSLAVLSIKVDTLVRQTEDTNETLRSLTRAVTQLAVIEERQTADRQAVDRAFGEIKAVQTAAERLERETDSRISGVATNIDSRLKALESRAPINDLSNGVIAKMAWLVISAVVGAILVLVLGKSASQTPIFIQQAPAERAAKIAR